MIENLKRQSWKKCILNMEHDIHGRQVKLLKQFDRRKGYDATQCKPRTTIDNLLPKSVQHSRSIKVNHRK